MRSKGEMIEFITKDRAVLHGFLMGKRVSDTCIVHVHGLDGNFYASELPYWLARRSLRVGISLFSINTRGHDVVSRTHVKKGNERTYFTAGTALEDFRDSFLDIDGAISALKDMGFMRFILSGHSTGCQKITYYQYRKKGRDVAGLLLLAPADDYNIRRKRLGKRFGKAVRISKMLVSKRRGDKTDLRIPAHLSANRFLSLADLKNVEARLFNYDGPLREFSSITVPIFAVFGSREQYAMKPVSRYLKILKEKSRSSAFISGIVKGAKHSFRNHETELSSMVFEWLKTFS